MVGNVASRPIVIETHSHDISEREKRARCLSIQSRLSRATGATVRVKPTLEGPLEGFT